MTQVLMANQSTRRVDVFVETHWAVLSLEATDQIYTTQTLVVFSLVRYINKVWQKWTDTKNRVFNVAYVLCLSPEASPLMTTAVISCKQVQQLCNLSPCLSQVCLVCQWDVSMWQSPPGQLKLKLSCNLWFSVDCSWKESRQLLVM